MQVPLGFVCQNRYRFNVHPLNQARRHKCFCFLTHVLTFTALVSNVSDLRHSLWMSSACPFVFTVFPPQLSVNTFLNHLTFCTVMERQYCLMACLSTWRSLKYTLHFASTYPLMPKIYLLALCCVLLAVNERRRVEGYFVDMLYDMEWRSFWV